LSGQPIQQLCRDIVAEVLPIVTAPRVKASEREKGTIQDLLETYEDTKP
jgi:hypothetical protein